MCVMSVTNCHLALTLCVSVLNNCNHEPALSILLPPTQRHDPTSAFSHTAKITPMQQIELVHVLLGTV